MDESRSNGAALVRSHASSTDAVSLDALVAERRRNVLDTARQLEAQLGKTADHVSARFDAARSTVASHETGFLPSPTGASVPTMLRTWWCRKDGARTAISISSP